MKYVLSEKSQSYATNFHAVIHGAHGSPVSEELMYIAKVSIRSASRDQSFRNKFLGRFQHEPATSDDLRYEMFSITSLIARTTYPTFSAFNPLKLIRPVSIMYT